jgi:hypothetical protein
MFPHDPMSWFIMIGNLVVLIVLYRLLRQRRAG